MLVHFSTGYYDEDNNLISDGGKYYGNLYNPIYRGSHGGSGSSGTGGRGGGYVRLTISSHLLVDGIIDVDGSHGDSDSGGGSGGTVDIRYRQIAISILREKS